MENCFMNPLTLEWIEKAEGDFTTSGREVRARLHPNYDAACFHAQQAAEKYLKAFLQEKGHNIPRTHSLLELLALCLRINPAFQLIRADLNTLEGYATAFRYPGQSADRAEALAAHRNVSTVRRQVREFLGLDRNNTNR